MAYFHIMKNPSMPVEGKVPSIALRGRDRYNGVIAIKAGFCWPAFLWSVFLGLMFGYVSSITFLIWAGTHRMWLLGFVGAIVIVASYFLIVFALFYFDVQMPSASGPYQEGQILGHTVKFIMTPFLAIIIALKANEWRAMGDKKRGYERVDIIEDASSKKDAVKKYLTKNRAP